MPPEMRCAIGAAVIILSSSLLLAHGDHSTAGHSHSAAGDSEVQIEIRAEFRHIEANGIPDHETGQFPNRRNTNRISEQRHAFRVPLHADEAEQTTPLELWPFRVALNGVPFDPGAAEFWRRDRRSGWHITEEFPFIPRQLRGTPDRSFQRQGPPGGPGAPPRRRPPPPGRPPRRTK